MTAGSAQVVSSVCCCACSVVSGGKKRDNKKKRISELSFVSGRGEIPFQRGKKKFPCRPLSRIFFAWQMRRDGSSFYSSAHLHKYRLSLGAQCCSSAGIPRISCFPSVPVSTCARAPFHFKISFLKSAASSWADKRIVRR